MVGDTGRIDDDVVRDVENAWQGRGKTNVIRFSVPADTRAYLRNFQIINVASHSFLTGLVVHEPLEHVRTSLNTDSLDTRVLKNV